MPQPEWFFGTYEHSLDEKGRVILPAKIRAHLSNSVYLTEHAQQCIALWRQDEFQEEVTRRLAEADRGPLELNDVRDWAATVNEAEVDRQGRIAIPQKLRTYASLEQGVVVAGMITRVELWSPDVWARKHDLARAELASATAPLPTSAPPRQDSEPG